MGSGLVQLSRGERWSVFQRFTYRKKLSFMFPDTPCHETWRPSEFLLTY